MAGGTGTYAYFTFTPTGGKMPLSVVFTPTINNASSYKIVSCLWKFGDGEQSTEIAPTHIYKTAGSFYASLTCTVEAIV